MKRVDLRGTSITDAGLEHLKEMTDLEQIWLSGTRISGAGFARFDAGLVNLKTLLTSQTRVDIGGLAHLRGLTGLISLGLSGTRVTDAGMIHMKELKKLQVLDLRATRVTDAGLNHIQGLGNVDRLFTSPRTKVTDQGMGAVGKFAKLSNLSLATETSRRATRDSQSSRVAQSSQATRFWPTRP